MPAAQDPCGLRRFAALPGIPLSMRLRKAVSRSREVPSTVWSVSRVPLLAERRRFPYATGLRGLEATDLEVAAVAAAMMAGGLERNQEPKLDIGL